MPRLTSSSSWAWLPAAPMTASHSPFGRGDDAEPAELALAQHQRHGMLRCPAGERIDDRRGDPLPGRRRIGGQRDERSRHTGIQIVDGDCVFDGSRFLPNRSGRQPGWLDSRAGRPTRGCQAETITCLTGPAHCGGGSGRTQASLRRRSTNGVIVPRSAEVRVSRRQGDAVGSFLPGSAGRSNRTTRERLAARLCPGTHAAAPRVASFPPRPGGIPAGQRHLLPRSEDDRHSIDAPSPRLPPAAVHRRAGDLIKRVRVNGDATEQGPTTQGSGTRVPRRGLSVMLPVKNKSTAAPIAHMTRAARLPSRTSSTRPAAMKPSPPTPGNVRP